MRAYRKAQILDVSRIKMAFLALVMFGTAPKGTIVHRANKVVDVFSITENIDGIQGEKSMCLLAS